jgi:hypothetical protein
MALYSRQVMSLTELCSSSDETVLFLEPKGLSIVATMHDEMHVPGDNQWAILLNAKDEPEVSWLEHNHLDKHSIFFFFKKKCTMV